ncbi:MAG: D-inositol-3-phosphate glycosyltransferase [Actinomycetota bacterium]|nr:D-inositol-3-phosphate glycosyltransferase [Actinomycetota bacterium]
MDLAIEPRNVLNRIALISYHSSPLAEPGAGDAGGMSVYVRQTAEALAQRSVRTDIYTRRTVELPRVIELFPGVRVICVDAGPFDAAKEDLTRYLPDFTAGVSAFAASQRLAYDVVHSHYWQSGLAGKVLARRWHAAFVHSNHTLGLVKNLSLAAGDQPEPEARILGEGEVVESADVLITSTDEEFQDLACLYGAAHDRLKTIFPGVDHGTFFPGDQGAARAELGLGDEAILLYVGRVQPLKGIELALRGVAKLVSQLDRPVRLLVVGGPSGQTGEEEMVRLRHLRDELGIADNVLFTGPQPHPRLPVFYRAADAAVVVSHSESFGLVALEAAACGTPVVGTSVGGLSHIVGDGRSGYLLEDRVPSQFAVRLRSLLQNPLLRKRFSLEAERAAARFSWTRATDELLALYECLVNESSAELCTC